MELLGKVIVYPVLCIVYIMLPFLNGPLSSLPSFRASFPFTVFWYNEYLLAERECLCALLRNLCLTFFVVLPTALGSMYIHWIIIFDTTTHSWPVKILLLIAEAIFQYISFLIAIPALVLLVILLSALVSTLECLFYILRLLFIYPVIKAVTWFFIVDRRACQFYSALAAVVLGVTDLAKLYAAIPIAHGIFLTIPDLDPDPWMSFKLRFSRFLMANMDEESLDAVLYSKSFKMVSCNEMMPVLRPVPPTRVGACFVLREFRLGPAEDGVVSAVEPEYKIGLGSITVTTTCRDDTIHVEIFTPYCGVRRRRMKNTPGARYNLHMSARYWRNHPEVGILNAEVISTSQHCDEAKIHCISIDEWITCCGSEKYVFMVYDCELGTQPLTVEVGIMSIREKGGIYHLPFKSPCTTVPT